MWELARSGGRRGGDKPQAPWRGSTGQTRPSPAGGWVSGPLPGAASLRQVAASRLLAWLPETGGKRVAGVGGRNTFRKKIYIYIKKRATRSAASAREVRRSSSGGPSRPAGRSPVSPGPAPRPRAPRPRVPASAGPSARARRAPGGRASCVSRPAGRPGPGAAPAAPGPGRLGPGRRQGHLWSAAPGGGACERGLRAAEPAAA